MTTPSAPDYRQEAVTAVRYLIGEVLTAHAARVSDADEAVADAERGVQYAKERYDRSPWPDRRLSEHLGHMGAAVETRLGIRDRLDHDPAYLLAVATRDLLDALADSAPASPSAPSIDGGASDA